MRWKTAWSVWWESWWRGIATLRTRCHGAVAQQAAELRQGRKVRQFGGSVGLDQRKLVKPLPDVAPLAAVQQDPIARGDVQVIEPAVADPGFALLHGTVGDGSGSEGQTTVRPAGTPRSGATRAYTESPRSP